MEARAFQDVDTHYTDPRNSEAARCGNLDPKVPISPIRSRTGKAVLTVPKGATPPIPCPIYDSETDWICAIHSNGNLLVFGADEVPEMARGKGSRLLGIPRKEFASGEERMVALASVPEGGTLTIRAGKRHTTLRRQELEKYWSERGKRGSRLPQGFRKVDEV